MEEQKISKKEAKAQAKSASKPAKDLTGDHPPPKRACSPWIYFNTEVSAKFRAEGKRKEAFSLAAEAWQSASAEEKAPYLKRAEEDKERVVRQTDELRRLGYYVLEDGSKSTDAANKHLLKVKAKKSKDDNDKNEASRAWEHPPPKRAMTAWTFFNQAKHPEYVAQGKRKEAFSLAAAAWGACTAEDKEPYEKLAAEDKARERRQATELSKYGYYLLEDGSKSTDPVNAKLLKIKRKRSKSSGLNAS